MKRSDGLSSIALVITYLGSFPKCFAAWAKTAAANPSVDFLIFADHVDEGKAMAGGAANLHFYPMDLVAFNAKANQVLGMSCVVGAAYKLCDYKPVYGLIYADALKDYDFWGYCDIDLLFGDIRHFLTEDRLANTDRFYHFGHFTLYRNSKEINQHIFDSVPTKDVHFQTLLKVPNKPSVDYHDFFSSKVEYGFDEVMMNPIAKNAQFKQYDGYSDYRDIYYADFPFHTETNLDGADPIYFHWQNGHLFVQSVKQTTEAEILYCHFMKRPLMMEDGALSASSFYLVPNQIIADRTKEELIALAKRKNGSFNRQKIWNEIKWHLHQKRNEK
jgi:hypothetical protein